MECVIMAVQISFVSVEDQALWFQKLTFDRPLGIDPQRKWSLTLKREEDQLAWAFVIRSLDGKDPKSRSTLHARGKQYKLFSHVVQYAPLMRSLSLLTLGQYETTARIGEPNAHLKASESTATSVCDTVSLDVFLQALGLLLNSSDHLVAMKHFWPPALEASRWPSNATLVDADLGNFTPCSVSLMVSKLKGMTLYSFGRNNGIVHNGCTIHQNPKSDAGEDSGHC